MRFNLGMLHETWKDQYDRMRRSYDLLKQCGERTPLPQDVIPARDVVYHFCCDAFHLRDWIAATLGTDRTSRKSIRDQLDVEVIEPSAELSACRDIANGFKHLKLDGTSFLTGTNQGHAEVVSQNKTLGVRAFTLPVSPAILGQLVKLAGAGESADADPTAAEQATSPPPLTTPVPATSNANGGYVRDTFAIDINGLQHDAQDVATKAVGAWDDWLRGPSPIAQALPDNPYRT